MANETSYEDYPSTFSYETPITCVNIPNSQSNDICSTLRDVFFEVGKILNLENLKGISIACGDLGYKKAIKLIDENKKPSEGEVIGCAMAITKESQEGLQSYIVLKDVSIIPLLVEEQSGNQEQVMRMLQIIAHECGHIHSDLLLHNIFETIPSMKDCKSQYEGIIYETSMAGWSEFSACFFSASIGENPEQSFREVVIEKLEVIVGELNSAKDLIDKPFDMMMAVFKNIGNLIKYSSYYLGWMFNNSFNERLEETALYKYIKNSWFLEYFIKLENIYETVLNNISSDNPDFDEILNIGKLLIEVSEHFGFEISVDDDNFTYIYTN